jgi:hypothetical protein
MKLDLMILAVLTAAVLSSCSDMQATANHNNGVDQVAYSAETAPPHWNNNHGIF